MWRVWHPASMPFGDNTERHVFRWRVDVRYFLTMCGVLLIMSCGPANPTPQTPKPLDMAPGQYMLIVSPSGSCSSSGFVPGVGTRLLLSHEGKDWVGRSPSADDGNIELRFHEVFNAQVAGVAVEGTLAGTGWDQRPFAAAGSRVSLVGPASGALVAAESTPNVADWIGGRLDGQLALYDGAASGPVTCSEGELALRRPALCELNPGTVCR